MLKKLLFFGMLLCSFGALAQHEHTLQATIIDSTETIKIKHQLVFKNYTSKSLNSIYLMDWANAFANKETPLAIRFAEDYRRAFHYAPERERGYTNIQRITSNEEQIDWQRPSSHPDVVEIKLKKALLPSEEITLQFDYFIKIPDAKFTNYGVDTNGYRLRFWHLAPCSIIDNKWVYYSHKNLGDFTASLDSYELHLKIDESKTLISNLNEIASNSEYGLKSYDLKGNYISNIEMHIGFSSDFYSYHLGNTTIVSDIPKNKLNAFEFSQSIEKIYDFVVSHYGEFPQKQILLSYADYLKQPSYGFNQLPKGITPFTEQFKYEIATLKQFTKVAKSSHFVSNLRTDYWFTDAIQVHMLMAYVNQYYPNKKLLGKLSKFIGVRWFHAADLDFNDQYYLGYKNMSSRFLQQALTLPKDSLLKFNYNISNPYKAGLGLNYLAHYDDSILIDALVRKFYTDNRNKSTSANAFVNAIKNEASKDISWFETAFLNSLEKVDVKIKKTKRLGDSIQVTLKNKGKAIPIKINSFSKKEKLQENWLPPFEDTLSINFSKKARYFALDFEEKLPEVNRRNNYWDRKSLLHKPLQLRLFQDVEDPKFHQTFVIPVYDFNVNDGLLLGTRVFNKELFFPRNFVYSFTPSYGLNSQEIQGSGSLSYLHQLKPYGWSFLNISLSAQSESFAPGLRSLSYTPSLNLSYRPKDLRSNLRKSLSLRLVSIERESSEAFPLETPNYRVFNTRYSYSNPNLTNVLGFNLDFQLAQNFSKLSSTVGYRKLFKNNQWIDFRLYAGTFLFNNTQADGDFFSFALDRPTDYLFDFNYLGRQDDSSFVSQQFISAEGNFKSRLNPRFANQWITTASAETSIWNWIMVYGDIGLVKNKAVDPKFLYDTGVKLNLVQDYLELYFPLQSSIGFEPSFSDYAQRIRFKFSLSINTLVRLFTREWY